MLLFSRSFKVSIALVSLYSLFLVGCVPLSSGKNIENRVENLETALIDKQMTDIRLSVLEEKVESMDGSNSTKPLSAPQNKSTRTNSNASTALQSAGQYGSNDKFAYNEALRIYEQNKTTQAQGLFQSFISRYPSSSLMPNAGYWLGECYYSQGNFSKAIQEFQSVYAMFPKHPKAADSVLKTAYSFERLGDRTNARYYYEILLAEYPSSLSYSKAREGLIRVQ